MKDADLDGEGFIKLDLSDILKLRFGNCQRNGEYFFVLSLHCKGKSNLLSNCHGLGTVGRDPEIGHHVDGSLAFQMNIHV